jgi:hypothetical protein
MNQNFSAQEYLIKIAKLLTDKINLVEDVIEYSNQEACIFRKYPDTHYGNIRTADPDSITAHPDTLSDNKNFCYPLIKLKPIKGGNR